MIDGKNVCSLICYIEIMTGVFQTVAFSQWFFLIAVSQRSFPRDRTSQILGGENVV